MMCCFPPPQSLSLKISTDKKVVEFHSTISGNGKHIQYSLGNSKLCDIWHQRKTGNVHVSFTLPPILLPLVVILNWQIFCVEAGGQI